MIDHSFIAPKVRLITTNQCGGQTMPDTCLGRTMILLTTVAAVDLS
jgi:hypothetical protein